MIISKTPLRVSFFGGGTDLPEHFTNHGGAVLGTAIDKFVYISASRFPSELFDYSVRLAYSKVENVNSVAEIEHAPAREILKINNIEKDIEVSISADLPSFSGLGSSSSFTVGMLKAIKAYKGEHIAANVLAREAIRIERDVLKESVGFQDQAFAAFGGFNIIEFSGQDRMRVERIALSIDREQELKSHLMMFYTGITRRAQGIEKTKIANIQSLTQRLTAMRHMVDTAHTVLTAQGSLTRFGELLHESWLQKRQLTSDVSNPVIDEMYVKAKAAGALGGKLLGAGGGGFMLFYVPSERKSTVKIALKNYHEIAFNINAAGSTIIHS
jgi:D-glycero-alpha-D-manno-heptose-7-phosphate kinase